MTWFKAFVKWFIVIFASLALLSYIIVTFGPLLGICFGLIYAACQSGNTWALFASIWLLPALIALATSPAMIDYMNLRKERKEREDEMDADR